MVEISPCRSKLIIQSLYAAATLEPSATNLSKALNFYKTTSMLERIAAAPLKTPEAVERTFKALYAGGNLGQTLRSTYKNSGIAFSTNRQFVEAILEGGRETLAAIDAASKDVVPRGFSRTATQALAALERSSQDLRPATLPLVDKLFGLFGLAHEHMHQQDIPPDNVEHAYTHSYNTLLQLFLCRPVVEADIADRADFRRRQRMGQPGVSSGDSEV